jgi:uncharacterized protein (DUF3820 family)
MDTYKELLSIGSRTTADHPGPTWGPSWLDSPADAPAITAETPENTEPEPLSWETCDPSELDAPDVSAFAPDDFEWGQLIDRDLAYLAAPRPILDPCPWCRRRLGHSPACIDLRLSWEIEMPFGKHKGRPLSQVPRDYLAWMLGKDGLTTELREAIRLQLYGDDQ